MISKEMSLFINNLQGNWRFIERFLNDAESLVAEFNLQQDEKEALLAREPQQLIRLGVYKNLAMAVPSGAHSQTCSSSCK